MCGEIHPHARSLWYSLSRGPWRGGEGGNRTSLDTLERRQVVSAPTENWSMIPRLSSQ